MCGCSSPGTTTYVRSVAPNLEQVSEGYLTWFKLAEPEAAFYFQILSQTRLKSACAEFFVVVPVGVHVGGTKTLNYPTIVFDVEPRQGETRVDPTQLLLIYEGKEYLPSDIQAYPDGRKITGLEVLSERRSYRVDYPFDLDARKSFQFKLGARQVSFIPREVDVQTQMGEAGCQQ
jgi:hypothetical protein